MIAYLLNFTLCSAVLLAAYHLLLKNKAMYLFNRFYLLAAVILSLVIPLIALNSEAILTPAKTVLAPIQQLTDGYTIVFDKAASDTRATVNNTNLPDKPVNWYLLVYALVSSILMFRFIKNLYAIRVMVNNGEKVIYKGAKLILIKKALIPHTFLSYIFLNRDEYHQHKIDPDILSHELAHARQHHSADVIFIELVQVFCWFNPLLLLYRRAMQLNHEFLADAAVLNINHNVTGYQQLLFSKVTQLQSFGITSQFNYSVTKKRLIMMTKTTSRTTAWFTRLATIPVMAITLVLFCNKTNAALKNISLPKIDLPEKQSANNVQDSLKRIPRSISFKNYPYTTNGVSDDLLKEYKALTDKYIDPNDNGNDKTVKFPPPVSADDKTRMENIFKQMSRKQQDEQKIGFIKNTGHLQGAVPTQAQLNAWKNKNVYGIWINEKHVENTELESHKPAEFAEYLLMRLMPAARHDLNKGHSYQVDLMTVQYYNDYVKESRKSKLIVYYNKSQELTNN